MPAFVLMLLCFCCTSCSIRLREGDSTGFFDRQIGRVLPAVETSGCDAVPIRDGIVEYVPKETRKDGWAVVWQVDTTRAAELSASSSKKVAGVIVAWRIIGDRTKVRIPVIYSAG